jgi:hypothetical protein
MKLLKFFPVILALSLILVSCSEETKKNDSKDDTTKTEIQTQNNAANLNNKPIAPITTGAPAGSPKIQQVTPTGINPAHGQPGHDCKIAVGAPLNSTPNAATSNPFNPAQQQAPAPSGPRVNQVTNQATMPGMNPPHGQPGHDCKIAVGAPLNSGTK